MNDVNIALFFYSFILLITIYIYSRQVKYSLMSDQLFRYLAQVTLLLLVFDFLARFQGLGLPIYRIFTEVGNIVTHGISHLIPSLWFLYLHFKIYSDTERTKKLYKYFIAISAINIIFLIITQFTGWYYEIDANNMYTRGPFFMYTHIVNGLILISAVCLLIYKRKRIEASHMVAYLIFSLIPATGLFAQILLSGVAYIPSSVTVSIVILFVFVQNSRVRNDHLTGIFNRRQLDFYLEDKIEQARQGKAFTAILLDLDDFKIINDTHGHLVGDEVIKLTAKLLDSCIGKNEFLARYGGDEFLIITTKYEPADIEQIARDIKIGLDELNKVDDRFNVTMSYGYFTYMPDMTISSDEFIHLVDKRLLSNKKDKKKNRGNIS